VVIIKQVKDDVGSIKMNTEATNASVPINSLSKQAFKNCKLSRDY
jgi:hypothetical protein